MSQIERVTFEVVRFATSNAYRGALLREEDGLIPFDDRTIAVFQEVRARRDNFSRFEEAGLEVVAHETDLVNAVRRSTDSTQKGIEVGESRAFPIERGRIVGENHIVLATELFVPSGRRFVVANAHPDVPVRPYARFEQGRNMQRVFQDPFFEEDVIFGMDANHYPHPLRHDKTLHRKAGFTSVEYDEASYPLGESKHRWLTSLGLPDGKMDVVLYKGPNLTVLDKRTVKTQSDHRARFADVGVREMYS
jgi:hypothetical protein